MRWWVTFYDDTEALLGGVIVTEDTEIDALAASEAFYPVGTSTAVAEPTSGSYPEFDDTFKDDTEVTTLRSTYGSPRITATPLRGDLLNRLMATVTNATGLTSGVLQYLEFADWVGGVLNAVDIDGGDATKITFSEAGVYAITASYIQIEPDDADALIHAYAGIELTGPGVIGPFDTQFFEEMKNPGGSGYFGTSPGVTHYLEEGAELRLFALADTSSGDWNAYSLGVLIQQVA